MKRFVSISIVLSIVLFTSYAAAQEISFPKLTYTTCEDDYEQLQERIKKAENANRSSSTYNDVLEDQDDYEDCHEVAHEEFQVLIERWNQAIEKENYDDALDFFQDARILVINPEGIDTVLTDLYLALAQEAYQNGDYDQMETYLEYAEDKEPDTRDRYLLNYFRSLGAIQEFDREEAQDFATDAKSYANSKEEVEQIATLIMYIKERIGAPSTDQLSRKQFRLNHLWIEKARPLLPKNGQEVVIAVIDSWIDTDHPDLQGQIRTNVREIPDNNKDDDDNGYSDDVHGYNFVENNDSITVSDGHGTLVAGVIGALQNNKLGISWILPNVKLMSLVACQNESCLPWSKLAEAINYAIDNGAHIINMSISSTTTSTRLHPDLTTAIARANNKNIIVVVAGGNGEKSYDGKKVGIDTDTSLVLPVCNEEISPKQIIGVGATDKSNQPLSRSNKGKCIDVRAYGEDIVSTSFFLTSTGSYGVAEGTSLASPMIAWIVGMGYMLHGKQHRKIVYDALQASMNSDTIPQADIYLDELSKRKLSTAKRAQITSAAATIYELVKNAAGTKRFQHLVTLKEFFNGYENTLSNSTNLQRRSIVYYLEQELKKYSLFSDL